MFISNALEFGADGSIGAGGLDESGRMVLARMPSGAPSAARVWVSAITPPLAAACAA